MPEGHTIHYAARQQWRRLGRQCLSVSSPQGRFRKGAVKLNGQSLAKIEAHGKHLLYHWQEGQILHVHLGLYGRFRWQSTPPEQPRGAVRLRIVGGDYTVDLNGPTACEIISQVDYRKLRDRLGPDPLRSDAHANIAWKRISNSRAAIGKLLLDQTVIAGIGNIYRSELLFALSIHPERAGKTLCYSEFKQLWATLCKWMSIGARNNRIITTVEQHDCVPSRIAKDERLQIYKRIVCTKCNGKIESWLLASRMIFACPACQSMR